MSDAPSQGPGIDRAILPLAAVVILGAIMSILDTTIVNVALETLSRELHAPLSTIQWVATGYLLALATVIPLTGWASERFGTKRLWMGAVTLFLVGSALSGLAWSAGSLIVFRILQGLGGGMILPVGQTMLARAAGPQRMGRVMSVIGVPMLLGPVLGPVIGGLLVDHAGWRWIFYVNIPIGLVALALAWRALVDDPVPTPQPLDWRGLLLLSPGLGAFVYGLSEADASGGVTNPQTLAGLAAGIVLIVAFVLHARGRGGTALLDVSLFAKRGFSAAAATTLFFGVSIFGAMILLPLYYLVVRGASALDAGLLMAPQGVGAAMAMPVAGRLTDRLGAGRVVPAGVLICLAGTLAYTQLGAHTSYALLACSLVVRGIGLGSTMMPAIAAAYQTLKPEAIPRASSVLNILQRAGGSLGTALLAVVLQHEIRATLHTPASTSVIGAASSATAGLRAQVAPRLAEAFSNTFWVSFALTAVALVPALLLPRRPMRRQAPVPAGAPDEARGPDPRTEPGDVGDTALSGRSARQRA